MSGVSVVVLTYNEEDNIRPCLESVAWCDDVVVVDSFSDDRTVEMAEELGARVFQRKFDDFAGQRNHANDELPLNHPWVLHLDADERCTEALARECQQAAQADEFSAFRIPSKLMFMGRWLKYSGMYPSYQVRLVKRGEMRFVQRGHGQREGETKRGVGTLKSAYLHYNFSKGLTEWFDKHNRYALQEARAALNGDANAWKWREILAAADPVSRRRAIKQAVANLPCRPLLRFLYMYLLRGGILDGLAGYRYCRLLAIYEYLIVLKMKEFRRRQAGLPI